MFVPVAFEGYEVHGLKPHVAQFEPSLIPILDEQEPGIIALKTNGHPQRVCSRRKYRLRRECDPGGCRSNAVQELPPGYILRWSMVSHPYSLLFWRSRFTPENVEAALCRSHNVHDPIPVQICGQQV